MQLDEMEIRISWAPSKLTRFSKHAQDHDSMTTRNRKAKAIPEGRMCDFMFKIPAKQHTEAEHTAFSGNVEEPKVVRKNPQRLEVTFCDTIVVVEATAPQELVLGKQGPSCTWEGEQLTLKAQVKGSPTGPPVRASVSVNDSGKLKLVAKNEWPTCAKLTSKKPHQPRQQPHHHQQHQRQRQRQQRQQRQRQQRQQRQRQQRQQRQRQQRQQRQRQQRQQRQRQQRQNPLEPQQLQSQQPDVLQPAHQPQPVPAQQAINPPPSFEDRAEAFLQDHAVLSDEAADLAMTDIIVSLDEDLLEL